MSTQTVSTDNNIAMARKIVESNMHLSLEERAALLKAVDSLEVKIVTQQAELEEADKENQMNSDCLKAAQTQLKQVTRELDIEAALEKIRSRSLAMTQADELYEVVSLVLEKLQELGITMQSRSAFISVFNDERKELMEWVASPEHAKSLRFTTPYIDHPVLSGLWQARERGDDFITKTFSFDEKNAYFEYYFQHVCCNHELDHVKELVFASKHYGYALALEKNSALGISSFVETDISEKEIEILKRFARVFEQAYIRFLDLKKSEEQAREARIEAALERLHSRTMAMDNSSDVGNAIGLLFTELEKLGIATLRCGVFIIQPETETMEVWSATSTQEGKIGQASGNFPISIHPMLRNALAAWRNKESFYTYTLAGEELKDYFKILIAANPNYTLPVQNLAVDKQVSSGFFFNEGALFTFTAEPHEPESVNILRRFASVFGLTYRRYLDLKMAEAQNRQMVKQASLDRLRAEIASMRSAEDLRRVTPLLWHELTVQQVRFTRCGFFIMDEEKGLIHAYLSTPQGQSRGVLNMRIGENEHSRLLFLNWQKQAVYTDFWNKEQLSAWLKYMNELNQLSEEESRRSEENLPESLYLHFVPFAQGMLYVGNTEALLKEEIDLIKSLSETFTIAYARYEDFRKLEEAKNKVEVTLSDLKAAQRQLIQSEKMASLGELTAGIAHEIQNPINFVNNFSEVSAEILGEVEEAFEKGDKEEIMSIVADVKENLQKIVHHGRRAEAIVKGMLLHSRASAGDTMPTDINLLADEYLRLSYHGLRAKDTLFNAKIITEFDPSIGKILLVPQDIGRALLNLFNNAFYAVNQKKKQCKNGFEPVVKIVTKKAGDKIEISVADNGGGIPASVVDKIFQPFFTTKPAGQGTGLGLSLTYDIVKGHNGELQVETKEGHGTEFKIILPAKTN